MRNEMVRPMPSRFLNKVVFVGGGSSGIGFAAAKAFLTEGAQVVICSRSKQRVSEAVKQLNGNGKKGIIGEVADLSHENEVKKIFDRIFCQLGGFDILVNAAGISRAAKVEEISLQDWYYILNNNLTNTFLTCKHALKYMKKKKYGKIVNVASIAGRFRSQLAGIHYTCAKSAVIALTKQLSAEAGPFGINVNVLCPSQTRTEMLKPFLTGGRKQKLVRSIPLGYLASPEQQAHVILFLASEESNYMNGAVVDVNGGQL